MLYTDFSMKNKRILLVSVAVNVALACSVIFLLKQLLSLPLSTPPVPIFFSGARPATNVPVVTEAADSNHP